MAVAGNVGTSYTPAPHGSNVAALAKTVRKATGMTLSTGATKRLVVAAQEGSLEDVVLDFHALPELLEKLREADPKGTYVLGTASSAFASNTLQFYYASFYCVRELFVLPHSRVAIFDGTHMYNIFGGVLLIAVALDTEDHIIILAHMYCTSENGANSAQFMKLFRTDFPTLVTIVMDEGTAFTAEEVLAVLRTEPPVWNIMCAMHLVPNAQKVARGCKGVDQLVHQLAHARTESSVRDVLNIAQDKSPKLFKYLNERKERLAPHYRLMEGVGSGNITVNQAVESINGAITEARNNGPARVLLYVLRKTQETFRNGAQSVSSLKSRVSDVANKLMTENARKSNQYEVRSWVHCDATMLGAIIFKKGDVEEVYVSVTRKDGAVQLQCPCKYFNEMGICCGRLMALIIAGNICCVTKSIGRNLWQWMSIEFVDPRHYKTTLEKFYSGSVPIVSAPSILTRPGSAKQKLLGLLHFQAKDETRETLSSLDLYPHVWIAPPGARKAGAKSRSNRVKSPAEIATGASRDRRAVKKHSVSGSDLDDDEFEAVDVALGEEEDNHNFVEMPVAELLDQGFGDPFAELRKKRVHRCSSCGGDNHTAPNCNSRDVGLILKQARLLPGQAEEQIEAKRERQEHRAARIEGEEEEDEEDREEDGEEMVERKFNE